MGNQDATGAVNVRDGALTGNGASEDVGVFPGVTWCKTIGLMTLCMQG